MLKSCSYCGGIHPTTYQCPKKPNRRKFNLSGADKFRNTTRWRKKSVEVRKRDKGLCQVCIRNLYNTQQQYTFDTIEVHHIVPLHEDITRGLDDDNLLSICKYHHYMADAGDIPRDIQHDIAKEQEYNNKLFSI
jgi:5-methylcytosine-specific restriction protein A